MVDRDLFRPGINRTEDSLPGILPGLIMSASQWTARLLGQHFIYDFPTQFLAKIARPISYGHDSDIQPRGFDDVKKTGLCL